MPRALLWFVVAALASTSALWWLSSTAAQPAVSDPAGQQGSIDAADYASLQEAIDALPETGGIVRIPPGTHEINQPLVIRLSDVCLEGAGTATVIKNRNTEGQAAIVLEHPEGARSRQTELWRIRIANLRVIGNPQSGHGIEARRINELFIDGVTVSEHGGNGIHLDHCYEDPRICDSLITYNKQTGLYLLGCHDIVVASNQFEENQDALQCLDGFNLCMSGNNLDDHLGRGVVIENTYGSVVAGNMIEECAAAAITLDRDCYGTTLSANVIAHNGAGIDLLDAHGCAVSANTFVLMKSNALHIGPNSGRIAVTGNSFCDSYIGQGRMRRDEQDADAAGLLLDGTSDVAISGNQFSGVRPQAIGIEGSVERVAVGNNVLTDSEAQVDKLQSSHVADNVGLD